MHNVLRGDMPCYSKERFPQSYDLFMYFNRVTGSFATRVPEGHIKRQTFTIPPSFSLPQLQKEDLLKQQSQGRMAVALVDFLSFALYLAVVCIGEDQHHRSEHLAALSSTSAKALFFWTLYLPPTIRPIRFHGQLPVDLPQIRIKDVKVHSL